MTKAPATKRLKTVGDFWDLHFQRDGSIRPIPRILCQDGFSFSAQASKYHYCQPRQVMSYGSQYRAWEVAYPSAGEPLFAIFAEDSADYPNCVCPYTPTNVVDAVIEKHGGLATEDQREAWEYVQSQGGA